jgi:hypothetical protein
MKKSNSLSEAADSAALTTHISPTPSETASPGTTNSAASAEQHSSTAPIAPAEPPASVTAQQVVAKPARSRKLVLPPVPGLTIPQRTALAALIGGAGPNAAARIAEVDRSTLYRWRTEDIDFIAALNSWRHQALESTGDQLLIAAHQAAIVVTKAIRKGSLPASLAVLKGIGSLAPRRPGPRDPDAVHQTRDRDVNQEYAQLVKDRVNAVITRKTLYEDGKQIEERDKKAEQKRREKLAEFARQESPPDKLNPDETRKTSSASDQQSV